MNQLNEIWSTGDDRNMPITELQMKAYLAGKLSGQDLRDVEEMLNKECPESEAIEGLQNLSSAELNALELKLYKNLTQTLKKNRKGRRGLSTQRWVILAVVIILLSVLAAYWLLILLKK